MNAVVVRGSGQSDVTARLWPNAAVALWLGLAGPPAWAIDTDAASATPLPSSVPSKDQRDRLQLEVSGASLPRFDNTDGSNRSSRIDMTWLPPRRSALGLSVGMTSLEGYSFSGAGPNAPPGIDLGLRWRYTLDSNYRIDVMAWRRLVPTDALTLVQMREPTYGARVEMQITSIKSGFVADRGFLGLQLESGARVSVRRSGGKPMIYYRTRF